VPRRKYGHLVTTMGKKHKDTRPVPGCPKCARGSCATHMG
jgi:hypothetical protein